MVEGDEGDRGSFAVGISYRDGRRLRYGLGLAVLWVLASFDDRRFPKGERKALWCARRCIPLAPRGIDAPTTARKVGLPPRGGQSFLSKRKKGPKKACGTATPEAARPAARRGLRPAGALRAVLCLGSLCSPAGKKPLIAHFDGGARNVARNEVGQLSLTLGARSCSPFSAV